MANTMKSTNHAYAVGFYSSTCSICIKDSYSSELSIEPFNGEELADYLAIPYIFSILFPELEAVIETETIPDLEGLNFDLSILGGFLFKF